MRTVLIALALAAASGTATATERQLLWGDTHLHTTYSSDAVANNNFLADPDTAYRYARGLPVVHPYHRARVQIETPLDFLVVSDHAEYLGMIRHIYFDGVDTSQVGFIGGIKAKIAEYILRSKLEKGEGRDLFIDVLPVPEDPRKAAADGMASTTESGVGWFPPMDWVEVDTWKKITDAADRHNQPGKFTALIGWEWSSIPGGANLHRVVMSSTDAATAQRFDPFGLDDSPYPEDLWHWLAQTSAETGAEFVAIPHNSNISKGFMFDTKTLRGDAFSPEYLALRKQWEPVVEITQIKGDSETHPDLSPDDAFADFETYPYYIQREPEPYQARPGDYVRASLKRGLKIAAEQGINPYQFGVIGSTDAHTALPSAEEYNFHGKLATDSIPDNKKRRWGSNAGAYGWGMSASGLAAVWAEENTRAGVLAAIKRREVYATTGPRIGLRFFGGWGYSEADLTAQDLYQRATVAGVPMGGELSAAPGDVSAPMFIVQASKDPLGANLDRVQIVKGWLDAEGEPQERVFDVVWSGARVPGEDGMLPAVGNSVDTASASYSNDIGAPELTALWQDSSFDPAQAAFYYVRVLQIPTPRHSLYDEIALGDDRDTERPDTIQERAYSSPIWFQPQQHTDPTEGETP